MSDSSQGSSPNIFLPGVVVAAVALIGYMVALPSLPSRRPTESLPAPSYPPDPQSVMTTRTFLWEDPLEAVYRMSDDDKRKRRESPAEKVGASADRSQSWLIVPVLLRGGVEADARESRMRTRYAILSALSTGKYRPCECSRMKHFLARSW